MAASPSRQTCVRCHAKKVRCTGCPDCSGCMTAGVSCEPYRRSRKIETVEALAQARRRVKWLEHQILIHIGIDCRRVGTGASIRPQNSMVPTPEEVEITHENTSRPKHDHSSDSLTILRPQECNSQSSPTAPDLSLLALNATGETRYLGPSSGAFFASYVTSIATQSVQPLHNSRCGSESTVPGTNGSHSTRTSVERSLPILSLVDAQDLVQSYKMWISPMYPLLSPAYLDSLVHKSQDFYADPDIAGFDDATKVTEMIMFYLVMAIGAANLQNTAKQLHATREIGELPTSRLSPSNLYSAALDLLNKGVKDMRTNVSTIQILLLICIYSSYRSIQSTPWQLSGIAMRMAIEMGLHNAASNNEFSPDDINRRSRTFWTAYAIELSAAYNLGRPPSIGEDFITANLPCSDETTTLSIHYINHRRIQHRIISQAYSNTHQQQNLTSGQRQDTISRLQAELDTWRRDLTTLRCVGIDSPYTLSYWDRLYHGTSFVLHRSSPLCPTPTDASLEQCVRSAGAYLQCMVDVLRHSNVPLTWMLIQGILFAGLTILVTVRTGLQNLMRHSGLSILLVDLPSWTRKCSICLAIVRERWNDELLTRLDSQFEALANDTIKLISAGVTGDKSGTTATRSDLAPTLLAERLDTTRNIFIEPSEPQPANQEDQHPDSIHGEDLEQSQIFRDFLGIDEGSHSFWDSFLFEMEPQ